jgi:glycosyltransferase involved in cell wall biosynthesis
MRIVIDLQACQTATRHHGIGRYAMALTKAMVRRLKGHEVLLALNDSYTDSVVEIRKAFAGLLPDESIIVFHPILPSEAVNPQNAWRTRASELIREHCIASLNPDITHLLSIFDPDTLHGNAVTSVGQLSPANVTSLIIYDLIPFCYPEHYLADVTTQEWYYNKIQNLKKADLLLAISAHTRGEAIDLLNIPPASVVNILAACDEHFFPMGKTNLMARARALRPRYHLKEKFIMYAPSGFDIRKNIKRLIQAYALLPGELRSTYQLVLVGKVGEIQQRQIQSWADNAGLGKDALVMTGYVADDDLVALYNLADLFVFPSWHEGFGLPALEAMACGTPVIGSASTSIPEVIGRKDALFDPFDPKAIAAKIAEALLDKDFYQSLRTHSLKQAAKFSWEESARLSVDALEELYRRRSRNANDFPTPDEHYKKLIKTLASLPQKPIGPTDQDLVATANSIEKNAILYEKRS